jgi:hypothetical protein
VRGPAYDERLSLGTVLRPKKMSVVTSSVGLIGDDKEAAMSAMYEELARMRLRETLDGSSAPGSGRTGRPRWSFRFHWWRRHRPGRVEPTGPAAGALMALDSSGAGQRDAA